MATRNYVRNGRLESDEGLRRGSMVVRSEAEWRERHDAMTSPRMMVLFLLLVAIYLVSITVIWLVWPLGDDAWANALIVFVFVTGALGGPLLFIRHNAAYGSTPGLYQLGVQQSYEVFIPYWEVESTRRMKVGNNPYEVIAMAPKYERRGLLFGSLEPWTLRVEFLGEDGVQELERRVRIAVPRG